MFYLISFVEELQQVNPKPFLVFHRLQITATSRNSYLYLYHDKEDPISNSKPSTTKESQTIKINLKKNQTQFSFP